MKISFTSLKDQNGTSRKLSEFESKIVLFVYPKDNTPGCTIENRDFSHLREDFLALGIEPIGLSSDTVESHAEFCDAQGLNTILLSDPEKTVINQLGAYGEKNMYGVKSMGIIRSTFLIDTTTGEVIREWKNVRALGHAGKLLKELTK
jgi:thioredoxin-dependent peroxiredoxin